MKKSIVFFVILLTLTAMLLAGCSAIFHTSGTSQIVEKTYDFKDFTNVEISGAYQYQFKQGDTYSVVVSAHENNLERVAIRQSENTLHIGMKFVLFNISSSDAEITITMPELDKLTVNDICQGNIIGFNSTADTEIHVSDSSRLDMDVIAGKTTIDVSDSSSVTGTLTAADTQINVSSSSNLNMVMKTGNTTVQISDSSWMKGNLEAQDCAFTITNSSSCELSGSAGNTTMVASDSSNMNSPRLALQSANVTVGSSSHASIYTNGMLNVDISDSSSLDYYGNPTIGKTNVNSSSQLNHKS